MKLIKYTLTILLLSLVVSCGKQDKTESDSLNAAIVTSCGVTDYTKETTCGRVIKYLTK